MRMRRKALRRRRRELAGKMYLPTHQFHKVYTRHQARHDQYRQKQKKKRKRPLILTPQPSGEYITEVRGREKIVRSPGHSLDRRKVRDPRRSFTAATRSRARSLAWAWHGTAQRGAVRRSRVHVRVRRMCDRRRTKQRPPRRTERGWAGAARRRVCGARGPVPVSLARAITRAIAAGCGRRSFQAFLSLARLQYLRRALDLRV